MCILEMLICIQKNVQNIYFKKCISYTQFDQKDVPDVQGKCRLCIEKNHTCIEIKRHKNKSKMRRTF